VDNIEQHCRESDIEHVAQEDSQSQVYKNLLLDSEAEAVRVSQDASEVAHNILRPYQEAPSVPNDQEASSREGDAAEVVAESIRKVTIPNNVLSIQEEFKADES
jgi:hypothetical protein